MTGSAGEQPAAEDATIGGWAWAGTVLVCLCAALAAVLEAFLVPLYAGTVVVPIAVAGSVLSNWFLPRMSRTLLPRTLAALAPLVVWIAVMLLFLYGRPEGDVAFPGQPQGAVWVFYGTLFGGALAGVAAVATSAPPPAGRAPVGRAGVGRAGVSRAGRDRGSPRAAPPGRR